MYSFRLPYQNTKFVLSLCIKEGELFSLLGVNGAGKTTTCVNLATAMALDGNKVLVVDTDTQANTTMFLTSYKLNEKAFQGKGLFDLIRAWGLIDVENYIHKTQIEGIDVIVSNDATPLIPQQLETLEKVSGIKAEEFLLHALSEVAENYDYILIDCMPSLGMMTVNSLVAADSVIIPSQPNFLSTKGLNLLMHSISKVKRQINPRLQIDGILLTMVDSRTNNAKDIISSLRSTMGSNIRVFDTEIPHSVRAAECSLVGKSIFAHDKSGKVAAAYENLTKEVNDIGRETQNRSGPDWVR